MFASPSNAAVDVPVAQAAVLGGGTLGGDRVVRSLHDCGPCPYERSPTEVPSSPRHVGHRKDNCL